MPNPKITLYLDIVSPFGYMAYYITRRFLSNVDEVARRWHPFSLGIAQQAKGSGYIFSILTLAQTSPMFKSVDMTYVPIFLGGLFKMCDNKAPLEIKNKKEWINLERLRWARAFKIPIVEDTPKGFPISTLSTQRTLCALHNSAPAKLPAAFDALYQSFWGEGNVNIGKPEGFGLVLEKALGKDVVADLIKRMGDKDTKDRLAANTDQAMKAGAFGIPWFECTNEQGETESFWGFDHLGQVIEFLSLDRSADKSGGMRAML